MVSDDYWNLKEMNTKSPCRIFFVRTGSGHLIPWYTSGFQ